jgi:hypothetical protein
MGIILSSGAGGACLPTFHLLQLNRVLRHRPAGDILQPTGQALLLISPEPFPGIFSQLGHAGQQLIPRHGACHEKAIDRLAQGIGAITLINHQAPEARLIGVTRRKESKRPPGWLKLEVNRQPFGGKLHNLVKNRHRQPVLLTNVSPSRPIRPNRSIR